MHCHIARTPPPLRELAPEVPEVLEAIVTRLLAKVAEERYQSAQGLVHDLERCLEQWTARGRIDAFPLGTGTSPSASRYRRSSTAASARCALLLHEFEQLVARGEPRLVLVSGYSGIGKSSLVHELHKPVLATRGFFLSGKFDQYKRDIPYATVVQAFQGLVQELLAGTEEQLAAWRQRLLAGLGANGQLIIDVIPEVELILGRQPPVPELPAAQAESRFLNVFSQFIQVLARREHPLVLFLDDLQWADAASLKLLRYVLTQPETGYLLALGAYRDNEVSPSHPLPRMVEEVRKAGTAVRDVVLSLLSPQHVAQLVADTLHASPEAVHPLARRLHQKTAGNPFFAIQFLTMLYEEGLVWFDAGARAWRWDVQGIDAKGFTDNVVELMVDKLKRLPPGTQEVLERAACVGNVVDFHTLAVVCDQEEARVHAHLWHAVKEGLVLRAGTRYRFLHDRVQQAAYLLIPEPQRERVHLKIGRLLLSRTPPEALEERLFDIVNQLNLGASLLTEASARTELAELDLRAARRAKASTAYAAASSYLAVGMALLGPGCWEEHPTLAFALHRERAECEFLLGGLEETERLFPVLLRHAPSRVDKAGVYRLKVDFHVTRSENALAVQSALECLALFGIDMPAHPTWEQVEYEYERFCLGLGGRSLEALVELPLMKDEDIRAAMGVLGVLFAPAYFTDKNLLYLHLCHMMNLSLRYGNTDASAHGYAWFGTLLGPGFHRYRDGYRLGRVAQELVERHGWLGYRGKAFFSLEMLAFWNESVSAAVDHCRAAFEGSVEAGDLASACYSCNHLITEMLNRGDGLEEIHAESVRRMDFVRRTHFRDAEHIILNQQRYIQQMRGLTEGFSTFNGDGFDEARFESELTPERMRTMVCWYYVLKLKSRFMCGEYEQALEAAGHAERLLWSSVGHPQVHDFHLYRVLTLAALYPRVPAERQRAFLETLREDEALLREWADNHPRNFAATYALVSAERARLEGDVAGAMRMYEQALRAAREGGFIQYEALGYELAARFYLAQGQGRFGELYLREARSCYARWGAHGKVRELERRHECLRESAASLAGFESSVTCCLRPEQLELLSVVKASQAISGEIVLDRLIHKLVEVVLEQSGAQRGVLLLAPEGQLSVAAEAWLEGSSVVVQAPPEVTEVGEAHLPVSLLQYVWRTKQQVVLEDATRAAPFATDAYMVGWKPKAVLCLPILRRASVIGLLYLENNVLAGAFSRERLSSLELLASQAAISLENAMLYTHVQRENLERKLAQEALYESESRYRHILETAEEGVWMLDAQGATMFVNEKMTRMLGYTVEEMVGQSFLVFMDREFHAEAGRCLERRMEGIREQHDFRFRGKDGREIWGIVSANPLVDREGRVTGVLGMITDITQRKQAERERDRLLSQEQAARAVAEEAARMRNDFLSIASHEMRTPLTPLRLRLERLHRTLAREEQAPLAEQVALCQRQVGRMARLVETLLDVSRLMAGKLELQWECVDLMELVKDAITSNEDTLAREGCELELRAEAPVVARVDRGRLEQVLENLLGNAIKYGPGKPIQVSVEVEGEVARLRVRDHGIGISPEDTGRIFERFERAVPLRHYGGLGLGLYITREIVEAHQGRIRVESTPGEGSTFTVELPLGRGGEAT